MNPAQSASHNPILTQIESCSSSAELQLYFTNHGDSYNVRLQLAQHPLCSEELLHILWRLARSDAMKQAISQNPNIPKSLFMQTLQTPGAFENPSLLLFMLEDPSIFDTYLSAVTINGMVKSTYHQQKLVDFAERIERVTFNQFRKMARTHQDNTPVRLLDPVIELFYYSGSLRLARGYVQKLGIGAKLELLPKSLATLPNLDDHIRTLYKQLERRSWFCDLTDGPPVTCFHDFIWFADQNYDQPRTFRETTDGRLV